MPTPVVGGSSRGGPSSHRDDAPAGSSALARVVIAEDSVLLREGIARLLTESGFEVAGLAGDAEELLRESRAQARRRDHRRAHAPDPYR